MAYLRERRTKKGKIYDIVHVQDGKRIQFSCRTSHLTTAKKILRQVERDLALRRFHVNVNGKPIKVTKFLEKYFMDASSRKKSRVIQNERNYARKFVEFVGDRPLQSVNLELLDSWKIWLLQGGTDRRAMSKTTFNIERRFLHSAFNKAVEWGYLERNPVAKLKKLAVEEKRLDLKDDEIDAIFGLLQGDINDPRKQWNAQYNRRFLLYLEFLLETGLRRHEALELKAEQIDLPNGLVYLEKTKGKKLRIVPLNERALQILLDLGPDPFRSLKISTVSHKFNDILKRLGLTGFKLHSFRHTFATRLVRNGVDIFSVKELLGHADIRTSMVYAKADIETLRDAVNKLRK